MVNNITSLNNMDGPFLCQTSNSNWEQYSSHNNMDYSSVKHKPAMVNNITSHSNVNRSYVKPQTVIGNNITATTI
jgi:hypothetical protein